MLSATTGHRSGNAAAITQPGWKQTVARRAGNAKLVRVPRLVGFDYVQAKATLMLMLRIMTFMSGPNKAKAQQPSQLFLHVYTSSVLLLLYVARCGNKLIIIIYF